MIYCYDNRENIKSLAIRAFDFASKRYSLRVSTGQYENTYLKLCEDKDVIMRNPTKTKKSYNKRLFSTGLRKKTHLARFYWISNTLQRLNYAYDSVIELGCGDGKVLNYLPKKPKSYYGFDANSHGGLDIAKEKWKGNSKFKFIFCNKPEDVKTDGECFDIAICMETLEHVPNDMVELYLEILSKLSKTILVTVPNEKGIVFFFKYLFTKIAYRNKRNYTLSEFLNTTLNRVYKVEHDNGHKGFDYKLIIEAMSSHFDIVMVSGIPLNLLPVNLNLYVGIVGRSRNYKNC